MDRNNQHEAASDGFKAEMPDSIHHLSADDSEFIGQQKGKYPEGFTSKDDLNKDGRIDRLEAQLKVIDMKDNIAN